MEMVKLMITYVEPHASKKNQKKKHMAGISPTHYCVVERQF